MSVNRIATAPVGREALARSGSDMEGGSGNWQTGKFILRTAAGLRKKRPFGPDGLISKALLFACVAQAAIRPRRALSFGHPT
jgi:hypothetical protein